MRDDERAQFEELWRDHSRLLRRDDDARTQMPLLADNGKERLGQP